ncbi:MAG: methionyl-tRNA formyltransferase, partial [Clostridia bacterium]|nr:methionyl-tRNA formyltransferase [Clostridia bacterium]
ENHTVVGVVCQPDKPKGRGNKMTPPPTKELAERWGLPVFQPASFRDGSFLPTLQALEPDVIVVVAYGRILPSYVLDYPRYGCVNLHVSLLPLYRGAAPMQRAIMAGERETGVCVMMMDEGMDTGDVLLCERYPILPTDDYGAVSEKAARVGAPLLGRALDQLAAGTARRHPQDHSRATYAPKIEKEECVLDFARPAAQIDCLIRALSPAPLASFFDARGQACKAVAAHPVALPPTGERPAPGTVLSVSTKGEGEIVVACGEGALALTALIPAGKKRMSAAAFVCGRGVAAGDVLS